MIAIREQAQQGWLLLLAAMVVAAPAAGLAYLSTEYQLAVSTLVIVALLMLAGGTIIGSPRLVGSSLAPALSGSLVGVGTGAEVAWGGAALIGCLWYLALELAWASIEQRDGAQRSRAVRWQRAVEVATVVVVSGLVGVAGALAAAGAPPRSLAVRVGVPALILLGLVIGLRHLAQTRPARRTPGSTQSIS